MQLPRLIKYTPIANIPALQMSASTNEVFCCFKSCSTAFEACRMDSKSVKSTGTKMSWSLEMLGVGYKIGSFAWSCS